MNQTLIRARLLTFHRERQAFIGFSDLRQNTLRNRMCILMRPTQLGA